MLGLFAKKSDHPLVDDDAAKRILEPLPALKPDAAIDEAAGWLESLAGLDDIAAALRYRRVVEFDTAVITQVRRLAREYYVAPRGSRFEEQKRWQRNQGYWDHLANAYTRCLADVDADARGSNAVRAEIGMLYARLLHALAGRLRWTRLRYGAVDGALWQEFGAIYLRAAREQLAERPVSLYGTTDSATTPAVEYFKVLLFHASSIDNLTLIEIAIAERLLAHFLPHFVFTDKPAPETTHWIDAAQAEPPGRLVLAKSPPLTASLRLFGAGRVLQAITELSERIRHNRMVPPEINLGGQYPPEVVLPVLDHLAMCWSPKPPTRKHARHRIASQAGIVNGLAAIHWQLNGGNDSFGEIENWQVDDISQGGMSARLSLLRNDWIRVGALVGMRPEGNDHWLVGTIRRFVRESESQGATGIETLSKAPRALVASDGTLDTDIILLDPLRDDSSAHILLAPTSWEPGVPLRVAVDGKSWRLHPEERIEAEEDWLLGRCVVEALPD